MKSHMRGCHQHHAHGQRNTAKNTHGAAIGRIAPLCARVAFRSLPDLACPGRTWTSLPPCTSMHAPPTHWPGSAARITTMLTLPMRAPFHTPIHAWPMPCADLGCTTTLVLATLSSCALAVPCSLQHACNAPTCPLASCCAGVPRVSFSMSALQPVTSLQHAYLPTCIMLRRRAQGELP